ncbi:MAG: DUF3011 domain-containing protein [Candidatus Competibacteraceae bacterium]|jgi:hypothetical protein|nr:DUF3011 domain-containing protein [Candidatus Competibacteraceae bacterium]
MHYLHHCAYIVLGIVLSGIPLASAAKSIECSSKNFRYRYCQVDTDGYVRLEKRLSKSPCRRGRGWGYDDDGVWVDKGCAARFEVGRYDYDYEDDDRHKDDDDDDGKKKLLTTAAVIGGLALLGTIMSKNNTPVETDNRYQYPDQYPNNNAISGGQYGASVPDWAVGTFRGYDSQYKIDLELTITPYGAVNGYANQATVQGDVNGDQLQIGQYTYYLDQVEDGFRATRIDDSYNQVFYRRIQ